MLKNLNCREKHISLKINQWKCFFEHLVLITGIKKLAQKSKSQSHNIIKVIV